MKFSFLITPETFGDWTTQGCRLHQDQKIYFYCKCSCGTERYVIKSKLTMGTSTHCGCKTKELISGRNRDKLVGKRFGYLVAVEYDLIKRKWLTKCDCGKDHYVTTALLNKGATKSCGCKSGEMLSKSRSFKGKRKHWLNNTHSNMMRRCYDPKNAKYHAYGARGIDVYEPFHNFWVFVYYIENELPPRPDRTWTLNRIDNDFGYVPENIEWAQAFDQNINKQNTRTFPYGDDLITIPELIKKYGKSYSFWFNHLTRLGESIEEIKVKFELNEKGA